MKSIEVSAKFARLSQCKKTPKLNPTKRFTQVHLKEFEMHIRNRAKRLALIALLPVLAAPVLGHADEKSAMDACLKTFLESDLAKNRKVTVQTNADSVPRPLTLSGLYKIEVVAKGRDSGKQLARVVCHADSSGAIVAVNGRPSSATTVLASSR
jgi:hypothetical protein